MKVKYEGWLRFQDSGSPYRWWTFEEAVEGLEAQAGDKLLDEGPDDEPESRFNVRRGRKVLRRFSLEEVEEALGWSAGPWRPPREDHVALTEKLGELTDAVRDLSGTVRAHSNAKKTLEDVRKMVEPKPPEPPARANAYLRLKGEHQYSSGDPFTDWELLVDVPQIRATRTQGANPMHAAKGDILREEPGDALTPFELRRGNVRIADPEWWQVRHLFGGLREDPAPVSRHSKPGDLSQRLNRCIPHTAEVRHSAWMATQAIPEAGIRPGDFLVQLHRGTLTKQDAAAIRRPFARVPRRAFQALLENIEGLEMVRQGDWSHDLATYLNHKRARRGRDGTSPLIIFRELVAPVSEPIRATSDDAAIFELILSTGCGMPATR